MLNNRIFSQHIELKQLNDSYSMNSLREKSSIQIEMHEQIKLSDQQGSSKKVQKVSEYNINSNDLFHLDNTILANRAMEFDKQNNIINN